MSELSFRSRKMLRFLRGELGHPDWPREHLPGYAPGDWVMLMRVPYFGIKSTHELLDAGLIERRGQSGIDRYYFRAFNPWHAEDFGDLWVG